MSDEIDDDRRWSPALRGGFDSPVARAVMASLRDTIKAHGPITEAGLASAAKRVLGAVKTAQHNEQKERKVPCGIAVFLTNTKEHGTPEYGRILMGKRKGAHGAGTWCLPGGWMRHGESFTDAARREVFEETGIEILDDVIFHNVKNTVFKDRDVHSITISVVAPTWAGTPVAKEPDKLDGEWQWVHPMCPPQPLFEPLGDPGPFGFVEQALVGMGRGRGTK